MTLRRLIQMTLWPGLLLACSTTKQPESLSEGKLPSAPASRHVVVTYHPAATKIGYEILDKGGNAFDAFVAATAAEYVLGEGVTSLAGPLGALLFDVKTGRAEFMDAGFASPMDPRQKWDPKNPQPGAAALVPGAVAGLEAISKKYGRLSFSEELQPAIHLAENGFLLSPLYAALIASPEYGGLLRKTDYGSKTYFREGNPLRAGELLKLPTVANFLRKLAIHGSSYVYNGQWARDCLRITKSQGGHLTAKDFSTYQAQWQEPWKISYRGYEINSPKTYGGLNTLMSLKVLEHTDIVKSGHHFSKSADALEMMARVQNIVGNEPWLHDQTKIRDEDFLQSVFSQDYVDGVWAKVEKKIQFATEATGTHSYQIVVIDKEGNAATGTNTIESLPWGKGIFVEGIPLTASGILPFAGKPGERRMNPLSMQLGLRGGKLKFASGAFSASMLPAAFEFIVNVVDFKLSANDAVSYPRFGQEAWDMTYSQKHLGGIWLDPRVDAVIVDALSARGLKFIQHGYLDTGLGAVALVREDGSVEGAFAPLSGVGVAPEKFFGIGASLDLAANKEILVRDVRTGSPAERAGVHAGDVILSVKAGAGAAILAVKGKSVDEVIALIRGPKGAAMVLGLRKPSGETVSLEIVRGEISGTK